MAIFNCYVSLPEGIYIYMVFLKKGNPRNHGFQFENGHPWFGWLGGTPHFRKPPHICHLYWFPKILNFVAKYLHINLHKLWYFPFIVIFSFIAWPYLSQFHKQRGLLGELLPGEGPLGSRVLLGHLSICPLPGRKLPGFNRVYWDLMGFNGV